MALLTEHPTDTDPEQLQKLVLEMARTINMLSEDKYLRALVDSTFETLPLETINDELKAYNDGHRPLQYVSVDDPQN